ncbi:hypothetical protein [Kyrpidia tusciae]|uniref:hypothetical protein n=1 Tax=Kyrpidia tusciae TaxID=33943 RepID=UPI0002D76869|nr:hypothetical protein [Kyrpidia tusciae]
MIERGHPEIPLSKQAELPSLNRTILYYKPVDKAEEEVRLKHRIAFDHSPLPFLQREDTGWA